MSGCGQEPVTRPARGSQQVVEGGEEDGMVDWKGEGNVAHVARAVHIVETTRPTRVLFVTGSKCRVIQSPQVGVQEAVKGVRVSNLLDTHGSELRGRVGQE